MGKYIPHSFQTPNAVIDDLMCLLSESEFKCYMFATRHINGWQDKIERGYAHISLSMFEHGYSQFSGTGLSHASVVSALRNLVKYGLLVKVEASTRNGQAYSIGDNPNIQGLKDRQNKSKSGSSKSKPVQNLNQQPSKIKTSTRSKSKPNKTQVQTQDKVSPPDESDGQPPIKTKRENPFGDGVIEAVAEPMFNATPDTIQKGNHVVYSVINGVRDAYKMVGDVPDNKDDVKHAVTDFLKWYARKYPNVPYVRQRSKLAMHYVEFLNSHKASQPSKEKQRINWSIQAQFDLGYEYITEGLFNDEIEAKIAEYERMEMS